MSEIAYIALGSNLGDRRAYLERARDAIAAIPECRVVAVSAVEETAPLGGLAQPPYLNQMLAVDQSVIRQNRGALEGVSELADIAGPRPL